MNIFVHKYLCENVFRSFGHIPGSEISGTSGNYRVNILIQCQTILHMTVSFYIPISNVQGFPTSFIIAFLMSVK
jgi:hypothetical protein